MTSRWWGYTTDRSGPTVELAPGRKGVFFDSAIQQAKGAAP